MRDRSIAHRMFKKAMQWGLIDRNPVSLTDRPKIDRRDPVLLRPEQLQALYDAVHGPADGLDLRHVAGGDGRSL